jgi:hypothetical protein
MPYIACSKSMEWVAQKCVENLLIINGKKVSIAVGYRLLLLVRYPAVDSGF